MDYQNGPKYNICVGNHVKSKYILDKTKSDECTAYFALPGGNGSTNDFYTVLCFVSITPE